LPIAVCRVKLAVQGVHEHPLNHYNQVSVLSVRLFSNQKIQTDAARDTDSDGR
jgi:hypothetical protein